MKATVEGIQRGHMLTGPLEPEGRKYLWCVSKVNGKHSVQAVSNMGSMVCEITLHTNGIHADDSEWKKVIYQENPPRRDSPNFGGLCIDNSFLKRHGERFPGDA